MSSEDRPLVVPWRPPQQPPPDGVRFQAKVFGWLKRVVVDREELPADAELGMALAGHIAGMRARLLIEANGMSEEDAVAAAVAWIEELALMYGAASAGEDVTN
jgi:hypothetical protein